MTELRPITPISITDLTPASPRTGEPIFESVDPPIGRSALDRRAAE